MRKRLLAAAVAIAALGGAGVAFAQAQTNAPAAPRGPGHMMERLDANNDGAVTRAEFDAAHQTRFTQLDTNRDGSISQEERRAGRPERPERAEGERRGPGGPGGHGMRNPDANNDGVITREEFLAGPTQMFERLDANRDGRLTAEERPPRGERHGWGHGRHHGGGMRGADANRDGNVTQAEFQAHGAQMFARMDANSDGRITADHEARRAARQQQRSQ